MACRPIGSEVSSTKPTHDLIMVTRAALANVSLFWLSSLLEESKSVNGDNCRGERETMDENARRRGSEASHQTLQIKLWSHIFSNYK
jgi:hypothetical protein